ncbi:MAG TPA: endo-1,4-beta-xylanase [Verrucomicrobiae bacterium]|nr:endo-1,4-beta-xylanase [Verrucomicrobiae bacterium]
MPGWLPPLVPAGDIPILKDLAAQKGILFGSATNANHLKDDRPYADLIASQCGIITPANELKMKYLQPGPNSFKFDEGDWIVHWAESRNIKVHGHALVYGEPGALPGWANGYINRGNARDIMVKHIQTVARHYAGKVVSWDVVNEALQGQDLKENIWLRNVGPDYLEVAFKTAGEADSNAMLCYNETNIEWANQEGKRNGTLRLLNDLLSKKAPVQALGIQSHLRYEMGGFDPGKMRKFLKQVSDLGLKIRISELDARELPSDSDVNSRDRDVAKYYADYLDTVLQNTNVIVVETWNLTDRYTWLTKEAPRADGQAVRPLPFDENLQPKPAFEALVQAFERAPSR